MLVLYMVYEADTYVWSVAWSVVHSYIIMCSVISHGKSHFNTFHLHWGIEVLRNTEQVNEINLSYTLECRLAHI